MATCPAWRKSSSSRAPATRSRRRNADWAAFGFAAFRAANRELHTEAGEARLDAMSVPEWLDSTPIGAHSRFGRLMLANAVTENGGDPGDMSALDLVELLSGNPRTSVIPLPGDDERYHLVGGNDQLVAGMIAALPPETVQQDRTLAAICRNSDRSLTLSFEGSGGDQPGDGATSSCWRCRSDAARCRLSRSGLPPDKRRVIRTMGMGTNAKIHLELSHKTWPKLGYSGVTYGEWDRLACSWDDCVQLGPDASPALYLAFPGAQDGPHRHHRCRRTAPRPPADAAWALGEIEHLYPDTTAAYTGRRLRGPLGARSVRRAAPTPTTASGRPPPTGRSRGAPTDGSCSRASTPRSPTSAFSTGQSKRVSGPHGGC